MEFAIETIGLTKTFGSGSSLRSLRLGGLQRLHVETRRARSVTADTHRGGFAGGGGPRAVACHDAAVLSRRNRQIRSQEGGAEDPAQAKPTPPVCGADDSICHGRRGGAGNGDASFAPARAGIQNGHAHAGGDSCGSVRLDLSQVSGFAQSCLGAVCDYRRGGADSLHARPS
jgi:hypothetical protein